MNKQQWMERKNIKFIVLAVGIVLFLLVNQFQPLSQSSQEDLFSLEESTEEALDSYATNESEIIEEPIIIYAEIKGAVEHPGVYSFQEGDRVIDLIQKAGGVTDEAAIEGINQALLIQDQMSLSVPTLDEWESQQETAETTSQLTLMGIDDDTEVTTPLININTADMQQLQTLPRIGPKKAEAIIAYREENGSFQTIEEIMAISGIGEKTFEQLAPMIEVGP